MYEIKLSDDVFEQIKNFTHFRLTEEQESLIDKLITDKELKERYKKNGFCKICKQPRPSYLYCQSCNSQYFKQNFKNWTSENHDVDEFIQKAQLNAKNMRQIIEWIEYDKFENAEYLAKGGFGITFKAVWKDGPICYWDCNNNQWNRKGQIKVALKYLHNSQDITVDFLKEVESNILVRGYDDCIVPCFGITKDPKTNNFMMQKLTSLYNIACGLRNIHNKGFIHRDFHCGNILSNFKDFLFITDLGLCQPANVKSSQNRNKKIYGVLPYVAPEVLRGNEYTQKSDIYGFGIIAYEICTGFPPYHDITHDDFLAMKICQDPLKRPNADELCKLILELLHDIRDNKVDSIIYGQVKEADEINKKASLPVQLPLSSTNNDDLEYSDSLRMDFTKLDINSKDKRN
ncbi:unnamed protein product [Rhizophagus irregularis]|nr:unnamed protein product [Rhizophagus irregularis]